MAIIIFLGNLGCLTGDSKININRCKKGFTISLKHLYQSFNNIYNSYKGWNLQEPTYVRSYDGERVRLHKINAVIHSGKREVFELELEDGNKIKATANHEFLTDKGWKRLDALCADDYILCDTLKPSKGNKKSYKLHEISIYAGWHPYKVQGCVSVHRLIYEAYMNNLNFIDYMDILWNDDSYDIKFLNPATHHIHHIDGNHYNNDIKNLLLVSGKEHNKIHAAEQYKNFNSGIPDKVRFKSLRFIGIEDTYDICCDEPYHNFVANGMIVHNSGKTSSAVWWIMTQMLNMHTFSNINIKGMPNQHVLTAESIISRKMVGVKKNGTPVYELEFNIDFWKKAVEKYQRINIVIDEVHTVMNARRSMSKQNIIISDFLAMGRRVLGQKSAAQGNLVLISQLKNRIDIIAREMATSVRFHRCHYTRTCKKCGYKEYTTNDTPEPMMRCRRCQSDRLDDSGHKVEVWHFASMKMFEAWELFGMQTFHRHYFINDIAKVFNKYDTLQWDNMISKMF